MRHLSPWALLTVCCVAGGVEYNQKMIKRTSAGKLWFFFAPGTLTLVLRRWGGIYFFYFTPSNSSGDENAEENPQEDDQQQAEKKKTSMTPSFHDFAFPSLNLIDLINKVDDGAFWKDLENLEANLTAFGTIIKPYIGSSSSATGLSTSAPSTAPKKNDASTTRSDYESPQSSASFSLSF